MPNLRILGPVFGDAVRMAHRAPLAVAAVAGKASGPCYCPLAPKLPLTRFVSAIKLDRVGKMFSGTRANGFVVP